MKPYERDELLTRVDTQVTEMHKIMFGNGNKGVVEKVTVLEANQKNLLCNIKEKKMDLKWIVIFLLAIADVFLMFKGLK